MKKECCFFKKIDSLWMHVKKPRGMVSFSNSWSHEARDVEIYYRYLVRDEIKDKSNIFSKLKIKIQEIIIKYLNRSRINNGTLWFYFWKKFNFIKLQNKNHSEVEPYNNYTKYMPVSLDWMNDESALYYSQAYLRFFIENSSNIEYAEVIEMSLSYFEKEFEKLDNVSREQICIAKEVVEYVKPHVSDEFT